MPKYRTLDQHVVFHGKTINPETKVEVPDEDIPIWEELVELKVAVRVGKVEKEEEEALEAEAKLAEPPPPKKASTKKS